MNDSRHNVIISREFKKMIQDCIRRCANPDSDHIIIEAEMKLVRKPNAEKKMASRDIDSDKITQVLKGKLPTIVR